MGAIAGGSAFATEAAIRLLIDASAKGAGLLLLAAAVVMLWRKGPAAARHLVWLLATTDEHRLLVHQRCGGAVQREPVRARAERRDGIGRAADADPPRVQR